MESSRLYLNRGLEFLVADSEVSIGDVEIVGRARTAFNSKDYGKAVTLYIKAWNFSGYLPIEDVDAMAECYGVVAEEAMNRGDMKNALRHGRIEGELVANVLRTILCVNEAYDGRFNLKAWEMTEHLVRSNLALANIWFSDKWNRRRGIEHRYEAGTDFFMDGAETLFYLVSHGFVPEGLLYATGNLAIELGNKMRKVKDAKINTYGILLNEVASRCAQVLHTTDRSEKAEEINEKLKIRREPFTTYQDAISA